MLTDGMVRQILESGDFYMSDNPQADAEMLLRKPASGDFRLQDSPENRDVWVCRCGTTVENTENATRGWLIAGNKNAEKAFNGEMVIRCPHCITDYAIRNAENGKADIR